MLVLFKVLEGTMMIFEFKILMKKKRLIRLKCTKWMNTKLMVRLMSSITFKEKETRPKDL